MSSMKSMISCSGAWGKIKLRSITRFKGRMLSSSKQSSFATYLADIWDQMGKPQGWETNGSTKPPFARATIPQVLSCHLLTWISRWLCQQPGRAKKNNNWGSKPLQPAYCPNEICILVVFQWSLTSKHIRLHCLGCTLACDGPCSTFNIINPRISGLSFYS